MLRERIVATVRQRYRRFGSNYTTSKVNAVGRIEVKRMRLGKQGIIFSATDLVNYLGCRHAIHLDLRAAAQPKVARPDDPFLQLLQRKGLLHEQAYLRTLEAKGQVVVDLKDQGPAQRVERTQEAMRDGAEVIYQAALENGRWHGIADFLVRVAGESELGEFHYEPVDTKLTSAASSSHAIQLSVYSTLLAAAQGRLPAHMHVVVGTGDTISIPTADVQDYAAIARSGLEAFADAPPAESVGEPCAHCGQCRWSEQCTQEWTGIDHLSQVANITRSQRGKLAEQITDGVPLSVTPPGTPAAGVPVNSVKRAGTSAAITKAPQSFVGNYGR